MNEAPQNRYDEVPYPAGAFEQCHPARLATMAALYFSSDMSPPPVETCRVLELGCGSGGNLFPAALLLPGASFVGVDYSALAIAEGLPWIEKLGLKNASLIHGDILDFQPEPGSFDYIIAHGVYSWVPRPVQEKLLEICGRALSPNGVAYVSYNVLPGAYIRRIARDIMRFHARSAKDPSEVMALARGALALAAASVPAHNPLYGAILKGELERVSEMPDGELFHDDLGELNEPFYFHQFIERAGRVGLKFLAEAVFADMQDQMYPEPAREALQASGDIVIAEQTRDFFSNRAFRQTLLCRADVPIRRQITPDRMRAFHVSSRCSPVSASPDLRGPSVERFKSPSGTLLGIEQPISKAALTSLAAAAPRWLSFDELARGALTLLGRGAEPDDKEALEEAILAAYCGDMVELSVSPERLAKEPGERPTAGKLARLQAELGGAVTSLRHRNISIDDAFALAALRRLDGTRDQAAIAQELAELVAAGALELPSPQAPFASAADALPAVEERLGATLRSMVRFALIEAPEAEATR